jgi:hypothetical protein
MFVTYEPGREAESAFLASWGRFLWLPADCVMPNCG